MAKIVDGVTWVCGGRTPVDYLNDCYTYNEVLNSWNVASGKYVVVYTEVTIRSETIFFTLILLSCCWLPNCSWHWTVRNLAEFPG